MTTQAGTTINLLVSTDIAKRISAWLHEISVDLQELEIIEVPSPTPAPTVK